jgi:predicted permease
VFSAVDAMLLRPLPVSRPEDLVAFDTLWPERFRVAGYSGSGRSDPATGRQRRTSFSELSFRHFRDNTQTLSAVFAFAPISLIAVDAQRADTAEGLIVSGHYFEGFGVRAFKGRVLGPDDDRPGAEPVAVISHRYWQAQFDSDPEVLGKAVILNGASFTIVGVLPPEFFGPRVSESSDITIPLALNDRIRRNGRGPQSWEWWLQVMGRLKPGATRAQALAELRPGYERSVEESWNSRPAERRGPDDAGRTDVPQLRVIEGSHGPLGPPADAARTLKLVFAIVVSTLLIGCVNLANLFLARASSRQQEISTRLALGSGHGRLIRQLLTECLLLACCGGALGLLLASWGKDFLTWFPTTDTMILTTRIDLRVFAFSTALTVLTGVVFGLSPSLRSTRQEFASVLRLGGHTGRAPRALFRKSLLVAQVAMSLMLIVVAGLLNMTLRNLQQSPTGFNASNLLVFEVRPSLQDNSDERVVAFHRQLTEAIEAVPGVLSATHSAMLPLSDSVWDGDVSVGDPPRAHNAYIQVIRENFFETMEMPVLTGRAFAETDTGSGPRVAVINESLARALTPDGRALGLRVSLPDYLSKTAIEVIGVVRDAKYATLSQPAPPTLYLPFGQKPQAPLAYEIRFAGTPAHIAPLVRHAVHGVDPNLPLIGLKTLQEQIRELLGRERMFAMLSATFGLLGLLMAGLGLYGVVSFSAGRRTSEIGLRMALGARRTSVIGMIMRETLALVTAGIAVGLGLPYVLGAGFVHGVREFRGLLFGVTDHDATTLVIAVVVMIAIALIASYVPARRASRIDPMSALRYE